MSRPNSITRDQAMAACAALGLDPQAVFELTLHATAGVVVKSYVVDHRNEHVVEGGDFKTVTTCIPYESGTKK